MPPLAGYLLLVTILRSLKFFKQLLAFSFFAATSDSSHEFFSIQEQIGLQALLSKPICLQFAIRLRIAKQIYLLH